MGSATVRSSKRRRSFTPEQREEWQATSEARVREAVDSLLALFESGEMPERIAETVIRRSAHDVPSSEWSLGNQILQLLGGTTDGRTWRQWQEVDRHVVKGARAFYILEPVRRTRTERDRETGEEIVRTWIAGFKPATRFRLEDTDGAPVETPCYAPPTFPPLYDVAQRFGVSVRYAPSAGRFRGAYQPGRDAVTLVTHDAVTWFHELGHVAHREVLRGRDGRRSSPRQSRRSSAASSTSTATWPTAPTTSATTAATSPPTRS